MFDVKGLLTSAYGEDFVRYVLNIPEPEGLDSVTERAPAGVLNTLVTLALQSVNTGFFDFSLLAAAQLSKYLPSEGTSRVQALRKLCGGSVPADVVESDDVVLSLLRTVARDTWPVHLIPPPKNQRGAGFFMANPAGIIQHPKSSDLAQSFMDDPSLSKLFPALEFGEEGTLPPLMQSSEWVVNSGQSGTRQMVGVLSELIYDAKLRVLLGGQRLSFEAISDALERSLGGLRSLADRKVVDVPTVIGFSGIRLAEGNSIEFTDGVLRGVRSTERDVFLNGSGASGAVFETTYPLRVLYVYRCTPSGGDWAKPFRKYRGRIEESMRSFDYSLDKVRIALLLCSDGERLLAPKEESRLVFDPTSVGGSIRWNASEHSPTNNELPSPKFSKVISMYDVIRKKHPESLNIAMKRLLSAASSRWDSNDALIDALIAWENMFGTRTETTFRVTASLAKLLEGNSEKRLELQKELNKLYGVRSSMVHGAKEPDPDAAAVNRERVIRVAIDGLRSLYHERPELLALPPEERSKKILLEG